MDIYGFDFAVLDFIAQNVRNAFLDPIMMLLSYFGQAGAGWFIISIVLLFPKKTRAAGAMSLCSMILAVLVGEVAIKHIVCRTRPYDLYESFHGSAMPFVLNVGKESSTSFPSSHTSMSFAAAVSFLKINRTVGIISIIVAALVGISRLYNYVHFPTDVLAGMLLGILCALLVRFIFSKTKLENRLAKR